MGFRKRKSFSEGRKELTPSPKARKRGRARGGCYHFCEKKGQEKAATWEKGKQFQGENAHNR